MTIKHAIPRSQLALVAVTAGIFAVGYAVAADPTVENQITVRSDRPLQKVVGRSEKGAPITSVEIRHVVSFTDLDLATDTGAENLKKRIRDVAIIGCKDLDKMYPMSEPDRTCVSDAVRDAMPQVNAAIAEAKTKAGARAS